MPPEKKDAEPDAVEKARQEGYEKAKAELAEANRKPLFEACRDYCKQNWKQPTGELREGVAALEAEYKQKLSRADFDLCLAQQRRQRMEAQKQSIKRQTGAITEYTVVN